MSKNTNILIRIDSKLKKKFKAICDVRGEKMSEVILQHIKKKVEGK